MIVNAKGLKFYFNICVRNAMLYNNRIKYVLLITSEKMFPVEKVLIVIDCTFSNQKATI